MKRKEFRNFHSNPKGKNNVEIMHKKRRALGSFSQLISEEEQAEKEAYQKRMQLLGEFSEKYEIIRMLINNKSKLTNDNRNALLIIESIELANISNDIITLQQPSALTTLSGINKLLSFSAEKDDYNSFNIIASIFVKCEKLLLIITQSEWAQNNWSLLLENKYIQSLETAMKTANFHLFFEIITFMSYVPKVPLLIMDEHWEFLLSSYLFAEDKGIRESRIDYFKSVLKYNKSKAANFIIDLIFTAEEKNPEKAQIIKTDFEQARTRILEKPCKYWRQLEDERRQSEPSSPQLFG